MHIQLLNMGFTKRSDGTYYNRELSLTVTIVDKDKGEVDLLLPSGKIHRTDLEQIEDAIVSGAMGDF